MSTFYDNLWCNIYTHLKPIYKVLHFKGYFTINHTRSYRDFLQIEIQNTVLHQK